MVPSDVFSSNIFHFVVKKICSSQTLIIATMKFATLSFLALASSAAAFAPAFGVPRTETALDMAQKPINFRMMPLI